MAQSKREWGERVRSVNNGNHAGGIGKKVGHNRNQRAFVSPKTSYLGPTFGVDFSEEKSLEKIRPIASSLDGLLWLLETPADEATNTPRKTYTLTYFRQFDWETEDPTGLYLGEFGELPTTYGDFFPISVGRDWILTNMQFIWRDPSYGGTRRFRIHPNAVEFMYDPKGPIKDADPPVGACIGGQWFAEDIGSILTMKNPYWERLNPPFGGYQFVHDFAIPRLSRDSEGYYTHGSTGGSYVWTDKAIPYTVREPAHVKWPHPTKDRNEPPDMGRWIGLPETKINYALFVVRGKMYVRSENFIGEARIINSRVKIDPGSYSGARLGPCPVAFDILNMHNFDVWRKNYPELDWDNVCIGEIGDCLVAFEAAEADRDPLEIGPMRIAATGKYIPLVKEVEWAQDPNGTVSSLCPPLKTLTIGEEEALAMYISAAEGRAMRKAFAVNEDSFKVFDLDADGNVIEDLVDEETGEVITPGAKSYRGANGHFLPGGNPAIANLGDMIICADNKTAFATETNPPFFRLCAAHYLRGGTLEQYYQTLSDGSRRLLEGAAVFHHAAGEGYNLFDSADYGYIETPLEGEPENPNQEMQRVDIDPFTWNEITSTPVNNNNLLGARFPIALEQETPTVDPETSKYFFKFSWVNPETFEMEPVKIESPFSTDPNARLALHYEVEPELIEFGVMSTAATPEGEFVPIEHPEYLNGWVGPTEATIGTSVNSRSRLWATFRGYKYNEEAGTYDWQSSLFIAPALDFVEVIPTAFRLAYMNKDDYPEVGGNVPIYRPGEYYSLFDAHFCFRCTDSAMYYGIIPADATITRFISMEASSGVYTNPVLQPYPRSKLVAGSWLGIDDEDMPENYYKVGAVAMVNWCKDRFRLDPPTVDKTRYRFQTQVSAIKCRYGENDCSIINPPVGQPWSAHRLWAVKTTVDVERYKKLASSWIISNPSQGPVGEET